MVLVVSYRLGATILPSFRSKLFRSKCLLLYVRGLASRRERLVCSSVLSSLICREKSIGLKQILFTSFGLVGKKSERDLKLQNVITIYTLYMHMYALKI